MKIWECFAVVEHDWSCLRTSSSLEFQEIIIINIIGDRPIYEADTISLIAVAF